MLVFTAAGKRKGTESALYSSLKSLSTNMLREDHTHIVAVGAYLLHKYVWRRNTSSVKAVVEGYIYYAKTHICMNGNVFFDG